MDAIKSLQLQENTIVVFSSDHGTHFATCGENDKYSCHNVTIRVPTVITGPGFWRGGTITEPTFFVDLAPTLLDACRLPIPEKMQEDSSFPLSLIIFEGSIGLLNLSFRFLKTKSERQFKPNGRNTE